MILKPNSKCACFPRFIPSELCIEMSLLEKAVQEFTRYLSWPGRRWKTVPSSSHVYLWACRWAPSFAGRNFCAAAVFPWLAFMVTRMAVLWALGAVGTAWRSLAFSLFAGSASLTQWNLLLVPWALTDNQSCVGCSTVVTGTGTHTHTHTHSRRRSRWQMGPVAWERSH